MSGHFRECFGRTNPEITVLLTDSAQLGHALERYEMGRFKEPMLHIWDEIRPTGHIHRFFRILVHETRGFGYRTRLVVAERR